MTVATAWLLAAAISAAGPPSVDSAARRWTSHGPFGGAVHGATADGVFRSTNAAVRWDPFALRGIPVYSLEQDTHDPGFLLAGTELGLYLSRNGGRAWDLILERELSGFVAGTAIAPSDSQTFYAAAYNGLFVTHDGGQDWTMLRLGRPTTTVLSPR